MTGAWPRGDPRDIVRAIVADPRYARDPQSPAQRSWFDMLRAWLDAVVRALLHGLDRALGAHNGFEAAIGFVLIAAALGLLGLGSFALVRSFVRGPRKRGAGSAAGGPAAAVQTAAALRAAALAAARGHRYREAAALLFVSALRALDERGRVTYDPARTPGEYRRLVNDPAFDAFAGDAVVAVFAAAEPPAELFERMQGTYERFFAAPA